VELLTKIVDRHTDVLQYQQDQIKNIDQRVKNLEAGSGTAKKDQQRTSRSTPNNPAAPAGGDWQASIPPAQLPVGPAQTLKDD
jgi:hypothetical protein